MSDPAMEAVQRLLHATHRYMMENADPLKAAREALKPIRELHVPIPGCDPTGERDVLWCPECKVYWPCATAPLIYSTEELA